MIYTRIVSTCIALGLVSQAMAQTPSFTGTVFLDSDGNGDATPGEGLGGVTVSLYQDNGDGVFDAATDVPRSVGVTDASGTYSFAGVGNASYFVHQPAQTVNGTPLADHVTTIANPTDFTLAIDSFSSLQHVSVTPNAHEQMATSVSMATSIIGGQRDLQLEFLSGPAEAMLLINPFGTNHVLQMNQDAGVNARATITWDGSNPALGLDGIDVTADGLNEAFSFTLGVDAAGAGDSLTMKIFSDGGVSTATIPITVTNAAVLAEQTIPFSSFSGDASFTDVDAIQLVLGGQSRSMDLQMGPVGVVGATVRNIAHAVPEPNSILMLGVAGLCLMLRCRRIC